MSRKTNKSIQKRFKVTPTGRVRVRRSGHGHFNAKASRSKQLERNRDRDLPMGRKDLGHYLPNG